MVHQTDQATHPFDGEKPLVSVIIPAFNAAAFVEQTLATGVRQLEAQVFDFVVAGFKALHYNSDNCCEAAGFFTPKALNTSA